MLATSRRLNTVSDTSIAFSVSLPATGFCEDTESTTCFFNSSEYHELSYLITPPVSDFDSYRSESSKPNWKERRELALDSVSSNQNDSDCHEANIFEQPCVRPKKGTKIIGLPPSMVLGLYSSKKPEKKIIKWRKVGAELMGFKISLFPRTPVTIDDNDIKREEQIFMSVSAEFNQIEQVSQKFNVQELEGVGISSREKFIRRDKDRRERKAHKQVKTKHITSIHNNPGRRQLFVHFRIYKMFTFIQCSEHSHPNLPSPAKKSGVCLDVAKSAIKALTRAERSPRTHHQHTYHPPQNLAHAIDTHNASDDIPTDVIAFLINLQHRDLTPEDYDMLLRLDEGIEPKTVTNDLLSSFKTDVVDDFSAGDVCSVCMEMYEVGQERKFLPCDHVFHAKCIDIWLQNSSMNCPLDGLPVQPS